MDNHDYRPLTGVTRGFAVNDTYAYDRRASERHWQHLLKLFAGNLSL
jgi:hypothetical protein